MEARAWKAQEETKRRQVMYFPTMTSKQNKLDELIDRYITITKKGLLLILLFSIIEYFQHLLCQ